MEMEHFSSKDVIIIEKVLETSDRPVFVSVMSVPCNKWTAVSHDYKTYQMLLNLNTFYIQF